VQEGHLSENRYTTDGQQAGDPVRAAEAIIKAVQSDKPPFRLALGRAAVERIRQEMETAPGPRHLGGRGDRCRLSWTSLAEPRPDTM
jgi:hypothetical protein